MKTFFLFTIAVTMALASCGQSATNHSVSPTTEKTAGKATNKSLFIDVHELGAGKVTFADVMAAHQKDVATEGKYGVNILKFWFDEEKGKVYCLSSARDSQSIIKTHAEAHGLLPVAIYKVTAGEEAKEIKGEQLFLDYHNVGPGNVTAAAVAGAHSKDLATQKKYGVNFINYWVDEKSGSIFCLAQAPDSSALIKTHKEAHGLLPSYVLPVKQGQ